MSNLTSYHLLLIHLNREFPKTYCNLIQHEFEKFQQQEEIFYFLYKSFQIFFLHSHNEEITNSNIFNQSTFPFLPLRILF